jgi:hypothetical protein
LTANTITKQIKEYLEKTGCFIWRQNNVRVAGRTFNGLKGVPDIIGSTRQGKFIGVEVKAGKDKMSEDQIKFKNEITKRGGIYIEARSLEDVTREI